LAGTKLVGLCVYSGFTPRADICRSVGALNGMSPAATQICGRVLITNDQLPFDHAPLDELGAGMSGELRTDKQSLLSAKCVRPGTLWPECEKLEG
jgi:hypothetical protein